MPPDPLPRLIRATVIAALAVAGLLACAGRASAGCGNYVTIIGQPGETPGPISHGPSPGPVRCQGPNCTGGPKAPAPVPVPPMASGLGAGKALVSTTDADPGPTNPGRQSASTAGRPVRRPSAIFHPPRAG